MNVEKEDTLCVEFGVPVRFLAVEWREPWEFDHPSVLLLPVFVYSPNGADIESLIEDAACDIADALESGKEFSTGISGGDAREFDWRGWDAAKLLAVAEATLRGDPVKLGVPGGFVDVSEKWAVFSRDGEDVSFDFIEKE